MFLMTNEEFLGFGKRKVIIVSGKVKNESFHLHHNNLINNDTTFTEYWNEVVDNLETRYDQGYAIEGIPINEINVWNMDHLVNKKIKKKRFD